MRLIEHDHGSSQIQYSTIRYTFQSVGYGHNFGVVYDGTHLAGDVPAHRKEQYPIK
jgi:hypothetical protein